MIPALAQLVGEDHAQRLATRYGTLSHLARDREALRLHLPPAAAERLLAALDLGAAVACEAATVQRIESPGEAARWLAPRFGLRPVEVFGMIALDVRRGIISCVELSTGCLTASLVHPREVFKAAIDARAAALVLFHNHPSGNPEPSAEDLALTRRLAAAGSLMGVEVLDHVVLGAGASYVSMKERGIL
jgi:DNA repair protein RadC